MPERAGGGLSAGLSVRQRAVRPASRGLARRGGPPARMRRPSPRLCRADTQRLSALSYTGPVSRTQTFLVMSHENDAWAGSCRSQEDRLRIAFAGAGRMPVFARNDRILEQASEADRGSYVRNPLWSRAAGRQLISVHPLGGCWMGDERRHWRRQRPLPGLRRAGQRSSRRPLRLRRLGGARLARREPAADDHGDGRASMELLARDKGWAIDYKRRKARSSRRRRRRAACRRP